MPLYKVQRNESPTRIARKFGVPMSALLSANPHKPTTTVAGQRTWRAIGVGESINVPGNVGATAADAMNAIIALASAGSPCDQQFVSIVCDIQRALGVTVDGKYGSGTAAAAKAVYPGAPPACSPRPLWWAPVGKSNCTTTAAPPPAPTISPIPAGAAPAAVLMLGTINPCDKANVLVVCAAQKALGVTVDGKYGTTTSAAARKVFPSAPFACDPRPSWWAPVGQSNCTTTAATTTAPAPAPVATSANTTAVAIPSAVAALAAINPCLQANVLVVYAAQKALGVAQDGKYGTATAAAAQKFLPSAPAACSPRPTWWAPVGQNNAIPSAAAPAPIPETVKVTTTAVPATATTPAVVQTTTPATSTTPAVTQTTQGGSTTTTTSTTDTTTAVTPPQPTKLSTGAIVAGALGVAAVVGVVALAVSGKKGHRGARGARGKTGHRKHAKKRKHK